MSWNSEGFKDPRKHLFVKEAIREHRLDFIAFLETGSSNFSKSFLSSLVGTADFAWFCLSPCGRSVEILIGINTTTLMIKNVQNGDFCVKLYLHSKQDGFEWILVSVYGAAQDSRKLERNWLDCVIMRLYRFYWMEI
jgi:hypothetical protein